MRLDPPAAAFVFTGVDRPFVPVEVASVPLGDGDLLVAIELATICGSDVHTTTGARPSPTPLVLGHEQVGHVIALGGGVTAVDGTPVAVGDRVTWSVITACGTCARCTAGLSQKCLTLRKFGHETMSDAWALSGGFATHAHVPAGTAVVIAPSALAAEVLAPASCATATVVAVLEAAARVAPLRGATVVVTGGGMLGLTAAAMARDAGARVILSDPDPRRRLAAAAFGAETTDPRDLDVGFAVGLEFSGAPRAVAQLVEGVDVGGVVVLAGSVFPGTEVTVDPRRIVTGLVTIVGVHNYAPAHLQAAVDYLASAADRWPFAGLVSAVLPLAQVDAAVELAASALHVRVALSAPAA